MKIIVDVLTVALPAMYFATVWAYAKAFFSDSSAARRTKTPLFIITLLLHFGYLYGRTRLFHHPPITTMFEIMSVIAFSIAVAYMIIEFRTKVKGTGYFILILAFLFQTISSIFTEDLVEVKPVLQSNLLGFHVMSALLGYTAIAISAVYGFLYLMLYHHIKSNRFGAIYSKLPNLEDLEHMSVIATILGFLLLGIAILVGLIWLPKAFSNFSYFDPKLVGTIIVWILYGVVLGAKKTVGWQGRKMMVLSIVGFAISFFSLTVVNLFFSGFHNFY